MKPKTLFSIIFIILLNLAPMAFASPTQTRIDNDIEAGNPIVIQVSVALADNKNQWIAPVPASIGDGQNAQTNLYWGARYGLKTYLVKDGGWQKAAVLRPQDERILERLVLKKSFSRKDKKVQVYLIADAWDGKFITDTIEQFLSYNAGKHSFDLQLNDKLIRAGGDAHLIVYIGHNALMDYFGIKNQTISNPEAAPNKKENDAIVLACRSEDFFLSRLEQLGAHPLVLTKGLMAPEAYSLHAAIEKWIAESTEIQVRKAAAASYNKYQKTGQKAAERLFGVR